MSNFSLKQALRVRLLEGMIGEVRKKLKPGEFMLLVVDRRTSKILSSCSRMFDVMQTDVMIIENLTLCREKLDFHAIYFIENVASSIKYLLRDFRPNKKPQYKAAHLYFTGRVTPEHMQQIQGRKQLVQRIQTFQEINVDFLTCESRVFSFARPCKTLSNLYLYREEKQDTFDTELQKTSNQLVSLCLTLKEDPYIRYWGKSKSDGLSKALASFFEKDFNDKKAQLKNDWKPHENRGRGTLLIVDRSIDPAAALMHEFTYQPMLNDLLKINGELCQLPDDKKKKTSATATTTTTETVGSVEEKEDGKISEEEEDPNVLVLSEDDQLWRELRHLHIAQVMQDLTSQINKFKSENKMAVYQGNKGDKNLKDMVAAGKAMAQFKEMMAKFDKHLGLVKIMMDLYESRSLSELGDLEQDLATGLTEEGTDVIVKTVKHKLVLKCQAKDIAVIDKMRLLMIYMISQGGIQEGTLRELMKSSDESLQKALYNLPKLGVDISASKDKKANPKHSKERKTEFQNQSKNNEHLLMRHVPFVRLVMSRLINWTLCPKAYPYMTPPPAGTKKPKSAKVTKWRRNKGEEKEDDRPLYILFIIGGVTNSEMRLIYTDPDLQKAKLIIGSTDIINPSRFIRGLADLSEKQFAAGIRNSEGNADSDKTVKAGAESDIEDDGPESDAEADVEPLQVQEPVEGRDCIDSYLDRWCGCLDSCM